MEHSFFKYQGTGNDFIIFDNRDAKISHDSSELFQGWCDRKFGIGADGIILIEDCETADFRMVYFNANGKEGSMCGNGGRCTVHLAKELGIFESDEVSFEAVDGLHQAKVEYDLIALKMNEVKNVERVGDDFFLDTGSPHYVQYVDDLKKTDTLEKGRNVRYNERFKEKGTNVNFVQMASPTQCEVVTYERGVEDLTLSCGTGVTAVAITNLERSDMPPGTYEIETKNLGGSLKVRLEKSKTGYENIWLIGPAKESFRGTIKV